jgi:ATP-dependent RNA helicase DDX19/DBP5
MTAEGHKVASLHGAKDASERDTIIDAFRQGKDKVSTSLCAPVIKLNEL